MNVPEVSKQTAIEATPWRPSYDVLPKIEYVDRVASYEDFFQNILLKNQLCIIGSEATIDWTSRKNWVMSDGSPNFAYLLDNFGESVAPVADCNSEEFCAHPKQEMTVRQYLSYWQSYGLCDHTQSKTCLYLKDWHLIRDFPGYSEYQTPMVLCSDWMNEFWDVWEDKGQTDDYRFVYMGPTGSWTPFHADVLHSYSWSANICGKKKWIFFPPGAERCVKDKHGHLIFDLRSADLEDSQKYPEGSSAVDASITVIQNPGEIIFVPSGWHHEVFNLEDTISINHNWINGCSAHLSWDYLKNRLLAVEKEIEDCKSMEGWHQQCQVMLKADSGIDYTDFYTFVARIANHRMIVLNKYVEAHTTADQLNVSCAFKHTATPTSDKQRYNGVNKDVDVDVNTGSDSNMHEIIYEDDAERKKSRECCHTLTNDKYTPKEDKDALACKHESPNKNDHSVNKFSIQLRAQTSSVHSKDIYDAGSELFDNKNLNKLAHNCLGSTSENNHNSRTFSYLCLFKGTVVGVAKTICKNDCSIQRSNEIPCDDDITDHQHCPHWAHTGPNLALFDLCRVLDIVWDMKECEEFKIIMEQQGSQGRISIPPAELVVHIESTIRQMTQGTPFTR